MAFQVVIPGENGGADQVFSAETQEELQQKLANAQTNATRKIREQAEELQQLRAEREERNTPPPAPAVSGDFDRQKFLNLLATDPVAANDMWFEHRFKAKPEEIADDYGRVRQASSIAVRQQVNASFVRQHPELLQVAPADDQHNSETISKILSDSGWEYTPQNLEAAFQVAKAQGKLKLPEAPKTEPPAPVEVVPTTIAASTATGPSGQAEEQEFLRNAPLDKVREYIEKKHAAGRSPSLA